MWKDINNESKIQLKIRKGIPETNSSSTHTLTLCIDEEYLGTGDIIELNEDGSLDLPWDLLDYSDEGRSIESCLEKAVAIACLIKGINGNHIESKKIKVFERLLKNMTGATKINYIVNESIGFIEVSSKISIDICENYESMKHFIFNSRSFTDVYEIDEIDGFYDPMNLLKGVRYYLEFGKNIGTVDIYRQSFPPILGEDCILDEYLTIDTKRSCLTYLKFDPKDQKYSFNETSNPLSAEIMTPELQNNLTTPIRVESKLGIIFATEKFTREFNTNYSDKLSIDNVIKLINLPDEYFVVPVKIVSDEYGEIR